MILIKSICNGLWIVAAASIVWICIFTYSGKNARYKIQIIHTQHLKELLNEHANVFKSSQNKTLLTGQNTIRKKILLWNSFYDAKGWEVGIGYEPFQYLKCPVQNCELTDNKSEIESSDAVLFHIHELNGTPPTRYSLHQRWVFWMLESPGWSRNIYYKKWNGLFNWTMTYRLDSDVKIPYGCVRKIENPLISNVNSWSRKKFKNKRKMVAWMVSNCGNQQSKREEYVQELKRYIDVDVYGRCGNLTCSRSPDESACIKMAARDYKFYLSFENSICKDYVTEKFFKILPYNLVPVVRGAVNYSLFAPSSWYINAEQFNSPQKLAEHLHDVGNNYTLYSEYLKGRDEYERKVYIVRDLPGWCELCQKLNDPFEPTASYDRIDTWWSEKDCVNPSWPSK